MGHEYGGTIKTRGEQGGFQEGKVIEGERGDAYSKLVRKQGGKETDRLINERRGSRTATSLRYKKIAALQTKCRNGANA